MTAAFASTADLKSFDASKHVNYTLGMVLGVDDFNQEFAYLAGHTRWLARDAVGYGTLCGLAVTFDTGVKGPRVVVSAGTAIMPNGQLVCVKPNQCAYLNDWLAANQQLVSSLESPPSATLPLDLVLCYRECSLDPVAIPGQPCRVESDLTAPSRVADSFTLELRPSPPPQLEDDLLLEFVEWLRAIPVSGGGTSTAEDVAHALREAVRKIDSPPGSPLESVHIDIASPPALHVGPAHWNEALAAAFRVWITEIRPLVHPICPTGCGCCSDQTPPTNDEPDDCLLLAHIELPLVSSGGVWEVSDVGSVTKDESRRPLLVHLRLQQEWLQFLR